ncbi:MAG: hypothetical protein GY853_10125 [PVC group bacterium]|nr:hypothetical protein [PVC group bacterium]
MEKIRLLTNLPIDQNEGATKGRVFDVIDKIYEEGRGGKKLVYFIGDTGAKCGAYYSEFEYVKPEK